MADDDQGKVHSSSDGGVAGQHPQLGPRQIIAGPSTADEFNRIDLPPPVVACFRVDDIRFAFDSSFVTSNPGDDKNDIRAELRLLAQLLKDNPQCPLSVYGHADPVGSDDYNKKLSGRRATVIYALLISTTDPDSAVKLWKAVASQENWGTNQRQTMQALTGQPAGTPDGNLFKAYMQKLVPADLKISKQDFLGQGADPLGKADYQGCSEFNPVLIFSSQRNQQFENDSNKTAKNDANSPNRRVLVLLFQKGVKVDPTKWPCPRAMEGVADCIKRFWSDGEAKRSTRLPDKDRKSGDDTDLLKGTFACRFYERMVTGKSPCEQELTLIKIRLFDRQSRPLPGAPCLVTEAGKSPKPDRASGTAAAPAPLIPDPSTPDPTTATQGDAADSGYITIREKSLPPTVSVKWSRPKAGDGPNSPLPQATDKFEFEMDVTIDIPADDQQKASLTRLKSLGYVQGPTQADDIRAFQIENKARFGLTVDGTLSDATQKAIKAVHDACDPVLKGPRNTPL